MSLLFDCLLRAFVEWSSPGGSALLPAAPGRTLLRRPHWPWF
ncbi:MAG: hypothetical protein QHH75_10050 [Bacillota bacterium]|nr:hypothetical protein [Bacillota bacterium]